MKNVLFLVTCLALVMALAGCGGGIVAGTSQSSGSGGGSSGGSGSGGSGGGSGGGNANSACSQMSLGQGASLNGFLPFASDSPWNADISNAAVDPNSTAIINAIGSNIGLHPDFGAGEYNGSYMGIPYMVVGGTQAPISIDFTAYGSESDPGPMPIPAGAPVEGDPDPQRRSARAGAEQ